MNRYKDLSLYQQGGFTTVDFSYEWNEQKNALVRIYSKKSSKETELKR